MIEPAAFTKTLAYAPVPVPPLIVIVFEFP